MCPRTRAAEAPACRHLFRQSIFRLPQTVGRSRVRGNDIIIRALFVLWRIEMDDYSGRLNALALVGAALLLTVVVIGLSGYDNRRVDVVKTVSISVPN